MHEGDGFSVKTLKKPYFIVKMTVSAMDWPASSDFWETPKLIVFLKMGDCLCYQISVLQNSIQHYKKFQNYLR